MSLNAPIMFIEINNENFIFIAGEYDESQNFEIKEKITTTITGVSRKRFTNFDLAFNEIKKNIEIIENKLNCIFKEVTIILDIFDFYCTNITGFKKLNGSQIFKENISYILNSLKLSLVENKKENKNNILHIFNSKSILDGIEVDNLPIGLFGDLYVHDLTFFSISNNDTKNINLLFNKNNMKVKKIFLKNFIEGAQIIKENNQDTFIKIKIDNDQINISIFYKSAFVYSENFNFGSDIIYQDIEKVCFLQKKIIKEFLSKNHLDKISFDDDDLLNKDYFKNENYRKIKKKLIFDVAKARVEELFDKILSENINIKFLKDKNLNFILIFQDKTILNSFKNFFNEFFSKKKLKVDYIDAPTPETTAEKTSEICIYGWKSEAIPVLQQRSSLITRLFKLLFG